MQLGFVIDHSRCIGCHACTVACKAENEVPLGSFRTWVKYTETGEFPAVRRHFAVLRCNQCSAAPCVTICPTRALAKRPDGIVDVERDACIGCKSCMQGCPYDALYLNPSHGTAEKCHFCAHRTERGLAPACAVVCPTEAIVPGDFDDPESAVSRLAARGDLVARKVEAQTGPNVWYREVDPSGVEPLATSAAGGYLWSNRLPGAELDAEEFRALERRAAARTTYDVEHAEHWGWRVSLYLLTKGISAGVLLAYLPALALGAPRAGVLAVAATALAFLAATSLLLVLDLKRPERFLLILRRPNWESWLVRGTWILIAYGAALAAWLGIGAAGAATDSAPALALAALTALAAAGTAAYTAFLFGQAKGRVLWMRRGLAFGLAVQALLAGGTALLVLGALGAPVPDWRWVAGPLLSLAFLHTVVELAAANLPPRGREREYAEAHALLARGPWRRGHLAGAYLPLLATAVLAVLVFAWPATGGELAAALLALPVLYGLWRGEDALVRAGQALPIS